MNPAIRRLVPILCATSLLNSPLFAALLPTQLRCEYLVNPLAIDTLQPRLSWILQSAERAQRQSAYRIMVATDPQALAGDHGGLWDSGKVASNAQMQIPYEGKALSPGQRAFWKVRVWDAMGRSSDSTEPAFWQAGLPAPRDWQAEWIAHPQTPPPALAARNGFHSNFTNTAEATQWVCVDLGERRRLDGVRLCPARPFDWQPDTPGFLFPRRFRVEASENRDFSDAQTLADHTQQDMDNPGTNTVVLTFTRPAQARFLRLLVTKLQARDAGQYAFALAELQVLEGRTVVSVVSRDAFVSASGSLESASWSKAFLVDGDMASHAGTRPPAEPATMLRKEFTAPAPVRRAMLWATALGAYQLRLNGRSVGDAVLPPEWTDYHQRVQYQAYDVTTLVRSGTNALAATLGDAWYAGRLGMSDGLVGVLRRVYGSKPWLLARLEIEHPDGQRTVVSTDDSWLATREGPIRGSDLLDGEVYDARRELPGWDLAAFDAHDWIAAESKPITERLVPQPNDPIRIVEQLQPISLTEPQPGVFVFDLGQNIAGRCRVRLRGPAGTTVTLRHAEMVNDDGSIYVANLRGAPQVDRYTLRGDPTGETFEPAFTQHGFRYVELTGLTEKPALDDLVGVVFNSVAPEIGAFECSDPMLNRLWRNILWTQRANLMSSPTDCPQRDERLGWMGDIQAFAQTAIFNMDMAAFFTKWVQDVRDAQAKNGRFPDFAPHPYAPDVRFSGAPAWADAGVIVPWRCYVNYADRRMLEQHFDAAVRWVEFVRGANPDLIWRQQRGNDYNDWLNGDWVKKQGWPSKGGSVPNEVFATAFFAHSTDLLARMARVLGREAEAAKFGELFDAIRAAFQRAFVTADGRIEGDTQAGYALALHFNLLPEAQRPEAARQLGESIGRYGGHLSTGIQSTHRALLELSERGYHELAWQLVTNRTFPSWGYMIGNGATTIWERWDGFVKGRGFQDAGMNSFNHWAFGAVGEWMTRHILGFQPHEAHPGWERFTIRPRPGGGVTWARGQFDSPRGRIASEWRMTGGEFYLEVTVPANATAEVHLPTGDVGRIQENGVTIERAQGIRWLPSAGTETVLEVASGSYRFRVDLTPPQ